MKVEKIKIKEFKILENFEKEINGHHILLMGDNGVGKSTVIQFIEIALGKQSNVPPGAKGEGEVFVNKDGKMFTFALKFKDGKPVVTVTSPEGLKDSRKGTIANIVGAMDFDIDEFVDLSKTPAGRAKQVEIFKSFLPDETKSQLAAYEAHVKTSYDERTDLNRALKEKDGAIKSHRLFPVVGIKKFEHKDIKSVLDKVTKLREENRTREDVVKRRAERDKQIADTQKKIKELEEVLNNDLELQIKADAWLKENTGHAPDVIASAEKELETIEVDNKDFTDSVSLEKDIKLFEKMTEESGELTAKIASSREAIQIAIREMDSPVDGLSFDDERLVYNGVPVSPDSLSTSEIMELGIRLKMAENPDLGILFIQRAESLGAERFKLLKDIADKAGWQIIAEQVERGKNQLHIEIMTEELITA
jgi:energy-coupling factor transporter ATP-binding protein EcfA2